ncbi:PAS domain-containing protein [Sphingomonas sp. Y38-1Y]|uniref:PAS domain-containing protein n=1 Tax=Sphingomonas sp. Y38-1Y TaxID=3078265 RepID=UPI0028E7E3B5|nr:PAS domain-containing protein [Sphingomonas sp. Y38-1Y]
MISGIDRRLPFDGASRRTKWRPAILARSCLNGAPQDCDELRILTERFRGRGSLASARAGFALDGDTGGGVASALPTGLSSSPSRSRYKNVVHALTKGFGVLRSPKPYPADLAAMLNGQLDRIFADGVTVENEVFYETPSGHAAFFSYLWGPMRDGNGTVELVVGVSRDTSERRAYEDAMRTSEARLRAATELVGIGIYAWNPVSGALDWDDRLRAMSGLDADTPADMAVFEAGIHPDDRQQVRDAIARCVDPVGDGSYQVEYRVIGREDGLTRQIATSGRTSFADGRPVRFIGAAIDVTERRQAEAAIRASEAQFRSFAEHSSNLIWIGDPAAETIVYRSAAFERIWGIPLDEAPSRVVDWLKVVHPDDRLQVEHALTAVEAGDVTQFDYRIVRPRDGGIRWLRDTSFPILDDTGRVTRIGGIVEDLTPEDVRQVYIVSGKAAGARRLSALVRALGYRVRTFASASDFLDIALVLWPGCVLVDLRTDRHEGLSIPRELKARSIAIPALAIDAAGADTMRGVAAMKAGAADYIIAGDDASTREGLASAIAECQGSARATTRDETASARIARLTTREREVLVGLVNGGTNKTIGQKLGISPRTVELHRSQVMSRLNASSLTELLQVALAAGVIPTND